MRHVHDPPLTRDQRQARRARWHGGMLTAWGVWSLLFGAKNFTNPSYQGFGIFPFWAWALAAIGMGAAAFILASSPRSMNYGLPGRLAMFCWFVIAGSFLLGDFRTTGVPIYTGLAINAYIFLVRE